MNLGGILNVSKPENITCGEMVRVAKGILNLKVGHAGTLDPMAKGVLLLLYGSATSSSGRWVDETKTYSGQIKFGIKTDTGDKTGKIIATSDAKLELSRIPEVFSHWVGDITQLTPIYSAVKWRGVRSYRYARRGVEVPRIPRHVTVYSLDLLSVGENTLDFRAVCSKGTYIRSLVEDIGNDLGTLGTLYALVRERVGNFLLEDSLDWSEVSQMKREDLISKAVLVP